MFKKFPTLEWMSTLLKYVFFLLLVVIIVLSLIPNPENLGVDMNFFERLADLIFGNPALGDKISHFMAYLALAGAGTAGRVRPFGRIIFLFLSLLILGGGLELAQGLVAIRTPDGADMIANFIGVSIGMIGGLAFLHYWPLLFPSKT